MNDEELKDLWQQQPLNGPPISAPQLISAMREKMADLRRKLLARDVREWVACVLILIGFGFFFIRANSLLSRLGDLVVIGSAIFIGWKLAHARRVTPPAKPDATAIEALRAELNSVRTQSKLLKSILWWYLLPIGIGTLLSVWGDQHPGASFKISFTVMLIVTYAFIYWVNQRCRTKKFLPTESQLEALLHSAETGEPLSEKFMETQTIISASTAAQSRTKTVLLNVGEILIALFVITIGFGMYVIGMFMNAIYVLMFLVALVTPLIFITVATLNKIYFGLLTKPFSRESGRYWLASLPRLAFYASCGYLLSIAIVPCQFPNHPQSYYKTLTWSLVALQLVLALMPPRRISIPFTTMYSIGATFMIWHFIQIATPAPGEKIVLDSPMKGVTCVIQGGNDQIINHHYLVKSQRYALDIFEVAENVQQIRDWKIMDRDAGFGDTVYSPCAGRVAHVERNHADNKKGQKDKKHLAGNYLTIEISPDRYVLIAHLKQNSTTVKVGDEVKLGQPIAQCGNSGNSSSPHVHIQLEDTPDFNHQTETYPIAFRHVLRGDQELENVQAKRNDLLLNTEN